MAFISTHFYGSEKLSELGMAIDARSSASGSVGRRLGSNTSIRLRCSDPSCISYKRNGGPSTFYNLQWFFSVVVLPSYLHAVGGCGTQACLENAPSIITSTKD